MRRMIFTAAAIVSLAAPSAALAHHGGRHHHRRHHGHAHVLAFHAQRPASATSGATTGEGESAGTIASYGNGVLTITLADGSTVSGQVTERTVIECPEPTTGSSAPGAGGFGEREHGDDARFGGGDWHGGYPGEGDGCPGHEGGEQDESCSTAALVPGASVKEALLGLGGQGAIWLKVEL